MEFNSSESYKGISFSNPQQAFNAILLFLADFYNNAVYDGPKNIFLSPENFFLNDFHRLEPLKKKIDETSEGYIEYGHSHFGPLTSMDIYICNNQQGNTLMMIPNIDNDFEYEKRILELLNNKDNHNKLSKYFEDKNYKQILTNARLLIKGTTSELKNIISIFENKEDNLGMKIIDSDFRPVKHLHRRENFILDCNDKRDLPTKPYEVSIAGDYHENADSLTLNFTHPKDYKNSFYDNYEILIGARNQFRQRLEDRLNNTKPNLAKRNL